MLLSDRERALLNFQKAKVLESGSTSASDDWSYEPAVALRDPKTQVYLKKHHADQINRMLLGLNETSQKDEVEARLLYGIATKTPLDIAPVATPAADKPKTSFFDKL